MSEAENAWRPVVTAPLCKLTDDELVAIKAIGGEFVGTYGEITERGFTCLAERLRLGNDDIFVDCGSGQGAAVIQAALEFGVRQSIGVEYAASRHARAAARLEAMDTASETARRITFIRGDCAYDALWAVGGPLSTCTCVYACNVFFNEVLSARLKRHIEGCGTIRCVAAYQRWPEGLKGFSEPFEVACETTWAPLGSALEFDASTGAWVPQGGSVLYVYERRDANAFVQIATSRETTLVVVALCLARIAQVLHEAYELYCVQSRGF